LLIGTLDAELKKKENPSNSTCIEDNYQSLLPSWIPLVTYVVGYLLISITSIMLVGVHRKIAPELSILQAQANRKFELLKDELHAKELQTEYDKESKLKQSLEQERQTELQAVEKDEQALHVLQQDLMDLEQYLPSI
jgi:hypothetical protein